MSRARSLRWMVVLAAISLLAAAGTAISASGASQKTFTIAFVYLGPKTDGGWSQGHDQSRLAMQKAFKGKVKTIYIENVPPSKKAVDVWNQLAARKVDALVDTTGAGQLFANFCKTKPSLTCATTYPALGPQPKNLSNFYVSHWLGSYLVGVAAGQLTKNGTVGYVAPFKVPTVNASVNAFALGCQSVRKDCTVKTVLTNSWYDPPKETEAAQTLLNGGADVMYGLTDDPAYSSVAAKNNIWTIGSYQYAQAAAGKWWVTGVVWDWTKIYKDFARSVVAGTWKSPQTVVAGLGTGTGIAPLGSAVPADVRATVNKVRSQIAAGKNVFKGPIYDSSGKLRVKAGSTLPPALLLNGWTWQVKGVESS